MRQRRHAGSVAAAIVCIVALLACAPTHAQPAGSPADAYRSAREALLRKPDDPEAAIAFARAAVRVGDVAGAIALLERLLVDEPDLPRIRVEIAALMMGTGALRGARAYLDLALESPRIDPATRAMAERLIRDGDARLRGWSVSGDAALVLRHQSNAVANPDGNLVRVAGFDATLNDGGRSTADVDLQAVVGARLAVDLDQASGTVLLSRVSGFQSKQLRRTDVNIGGARIDAGVQRELWRGETGTLAMHGYAIGEAVRLADRPDFLAPGVGIAVEWSARGEQASLELERVWRRHHISAARPFNDWRNGTYTSLRLGWRLQLTSDLVFAASAGLSGLDADVAHESFLRGDVGLRLEKSLGFGLVDDRPMRIAAEGGAGRARYAGRDPAVDPDTLRRDRELGAGLRLTLPVTGELTMFGAIGWSARDSSLPNYTFTNWSSTLGIGVRF